MNDNKIKQIHLYGNRLYASQWEKQRHILLMRFYKLDSSKDLTERQKDDFILRLSADWNTISTDIVKLRLHIINNILAGIASLGNVDEIITAVVNDNVKDVECLINSLCFIKADVGKSETTIFATSAQSRYVVCINRKIEATQEDEVNF